MAERPRISPEKIRRAVEAVELAGKKVVRVEIEGGKRGQDGDSREVMRLIEIAEAGRLAPAERGEGDRRRT